MECIQNLKYAISCNRWKILFFSCLFIFGLALGIFLSISSYDNCFLFSVEDLKIIKFLTGGTSSFSLFFDRFFSLLLVTLIILICSFHPCLIILSSIILVYRAYIMGTVITYIIGCCGFPGALNVIIIILPVQIVINFLIISMCCLSFNNSLIKKCKNESKRFYIYFLYLFLAMIIVTFIECLLLFIFSPNIIFCI